MKFKLLLVAALLFSGVSASAGTVTIDTGQNAIGGLSKNQGWWRQTSSNSNSTNVNYILRVSDSIRNYFAFDLSGLTGKSITSLEVRLTRFSQIGSGNITFSDVSTSVAALNQRNTVDGSIWADLGSGTNYGNFNLGTGASSDVLSFTLNAAAISDANSAIGGFFAIGGRANSGNEFFGFSTSGGTQELIVTYNDIAPVPLPAAGFLLAGALGGMGLMRRRKKS